MFNLTKPECLCKTLRRIISVFFSTGNLVIAIVDEMAFFKLYVAFVVHAYVLNLESLHKLLLSVHVLV